MERAVGSKAEESLRPATPAQIEIPMPLVFTAEDRVLKTIVSMDKCTCMCGFLVPHSWRKMTVSSVSREGESLNRLTRDTAKEVSRATPNETGGTGW